MEEVACAESDSDLVSDGCELGLKVVLLNILRSATLFWGYDSQYAHPCGKLIECLGAAKVMESNPMGWRSCTGGFHPTSLPTELIRDQYAVRALEVIPKSANIATASTAYCP
jgi:hypothetical protein